MKTAKLVHVRRCHVCWTVNERDETRVERCDQCGKVLAPYFFFDETNLQQGNQLDPETLMRPIRPLTGFSVVWDG